MWCDIMSPNGSKCYAASCHIISYHGMSTRWRWPRLLFISCTCVEGVWTAPYSRCTLLPPSATLRIHYPFPLLSLNALPFLALSWLLHRLPLPLSHSFSSNNLALSSLKQIRSFSILCFYSHDHFLPHTISIPPSLFSTSPPHSSQHTISPNNQTTTQKDWSQHLLWAVSTTRTARIRATNWTFRTDH